MRLAGTVTTPAELGPAARDRMFSLMTAHFDQVERATFERDLDEKDWVVVLRDSATATIQGFSTLMLIDATVSGVPIKAVFSGDTIIHRDYWGETELASVWGQFILSLIRSYQDVKFYWFLISKGFRTYKFLPVYFKAFYPRHDQETPPFEQAILDSLATLKFPTNYAPRTGVIRFEGPKDRLRPELAEVSSGRQEDPNVRFFLERNPGFAEGDELACLAELSEANLKPIALRVVSRMARHA